MINKHKKPQLASTNYSKKHHIIFILFFDILLLFLIFFGYVYTKVFAISDVVDLSNKQYKQIASFSATLVPLTSLDENSVPTPPPKGDDVITHGPRDKKEIALTFDGDMTQGMKEMLLSNAVQTFDDTRITYFLSQSQTKATFFLTGMWIELYPDMTKQLAANPLFELENHSYSHPSFAGYCYGLPQVQESEYITQITKTTQLLHDVAGISNKYFRFPGGCYDKKALQLVKQAGLEVVHWDDAGSDGFNNNTDAIVHDVVDHIQNGSIIVLHLGGEENTPKTADALPIIVNNLKEKGYTFVTVQELLEKNNPQPTPDISSYLDMKI